MKPRTAYLAADELLEPLVAELDGVEFTHGRLVVTRGSPQRTAWAQNIWYEPQEIEIASISDGAKKLRAIQRNWALYPHQIHRRAKLIEAALPHVSAKPLNGLGPVPTSPLGSWTLISTARILASAKCSSPFPHGEVHFVENHEEPPSRAYLKLWEAFVVCGEHPQRGERCLEIGAAPGGWTWVLAKLGAEVHAIDRADLAPRIAGLPKVVSERGDAFSATPERLGKFDWVFSDVACYPEKLLEWIQLWLKARAAKRMICTVKFQGKFQGRGNYDIISEFQKIRGSSLVHLSHNKHELTWIFLGDDFGK